MHTLRTHYTHITHTLRTNYAKLRLHRNYAKITQKLRKDLKLRNLHIPHFAYGRHRRGPSHS